MGYTKAQILQLIQEEWKKKKPIDETTTGALAGSGQMGDYSSASAQTGGFFIGPLGHIPRKELNKRLSFKGGKIVDKVNGQPVTEQLILEWFGGDAVRKDKGTPAINKHPFWKGGQFVEIKPKCLTFPYCSEGDSSDKPIRLIGETKETTSACAWDIVEILAEAAKKDPVYVAKLIREHYLQLEREVI